MSGEDLLIMGLLACVLVAALYAPGLRIGISLSDEGYLWHGVRSVLKGRVPIRDFRAYDPGRYYWFALLTRLSGGGLLGLRRGLLFTQVLALTAIGTALLSAIGDWPAAALGCIACAAWLRQRHKQIDHLMAMLAVLAATLLALSPDAGHVLGAGVFVGAALFIGLNHGLYAGAGLSVLVLALAVSGRDAAPLAWFAGGVALGILPWLAFLLVVPGMAAAYWRHKMLAVVKRGSANLRLPVPWLWRRVPTRWLYRLTFTMMLPAYLLTLIAVALADGPLAGPMAVLTGAACVGLAYAHHAFSRADPAHLAQSVAPLLFTLIVAAAQTPLPWLAAAVLAAASLAWAWTDGELGFRRRSLRKAKELKVDGESILVPPAVHAAVEGIARQVETYCPQGTPALFVPTLDMLYPLLDRTPAVYDTFCVYPANADRQRVFIEQLSRSAPGLIVIQDHPLDKRDDLRFLHTHPTVTAHIRANFKQVEGELPPGFLMFVAEPATAMSKKDPP